MKFFIIRIDYEYLNLCIRLLFKKHMISLRIIILKSFAHMNYLNENIIKGI